MEPTRDLGLDFLDAGAKVCLVADFERKELI